MHAGTKLVSCVSSIRYVAISAQWRLRDSNSRPPACKAGALPTELSPHEVGSHLLSHAVSSIVPSAAYVLTVVFGMGTGVSRKRIATNKDFRFSSLICFLNKSTVIQPLLLFLRKEVIQPHLPIRLPCYDFTPVIRPAFGGSFPLLSTT